MEASHDVLAILNLINTGGTVGAMVVFSWLWVSGRIVASASIDHVAQQTASETVSALQRSGYLPPSPTSARGYGKSRRGENKDFNGD